MTAPFAVRRARVIDAAAVSALSQQTFTEAFGHLYPPEDLAEYLGRCSEESYRKLLEEPGVGIWLAVPEGASPVGFIVAGSCKLPVDNLAPDAGEIRQLYVLATHQNERLGTRLMDAALDWLATQKRNPLYVGVWSENLGAQRFYARYGFVKVGEYGFPVGRTVDHEYILMR